MVLKLGPSCPVNGTFYICNDAPTKFIGCCMTDACANKGVCPSKDLRSATFNRGAYDQVPPQSCSVSNPNKFWFTCQNNNIPFLGCCSENPCSNPSGCPQAKLLPARLSDNSTNAAVFIDEPTPTPTPQPQTPAPAAEQAVVEQGLHPGAIAGIVIGVLILIGLIVLLVCWRMGWRLRNKEDDSRVIADFPATYVNNALPDMGESQSQYNSSNHHHSFSPDHFTPASPDDYNATAMTGLVPKTSTRSSRTTQTMVQDEEEGLQVGARADQRASNHTLLSALGGVGGGGGLSVRSVSQPTSPTSAVNRVSMISGNSDITGQYARVSNIPIASPEVSPGFGPIDEATGEQQYQHQHSQQPPQQFQKPSYASYQQYGAVPSLPPVELPDAEPVDRPMQTGPTWQPYRPK